MATLQEALTAALDHQEAGRFDKADILYRRILRASPGHPHALHLWGILAALTGRPEEAAGRIGQAIAVAPDIADFHVNLARVQAALNRPDRAARHYAHAAALRPEEAETRFQLAGLLQELGQAARARNGFRTVLVLEPAHPGALLRLAATEQGLGRAVAAARIDLALAPGDPILWNELANRLKGGKRRAEALAQSVTGYGRGLALLPGNPVLLNNRADSWLRLDRLEAAEEDARAAVAAAPGFAAGWNTLGSVLMAQGRAGEAAGAYEQAAGIDPATDPTTNTQARFNRSIALLTLGRLAEGWDEYEQGWAASSGRFPQVGFPQPLWDGKPLADGGQGDGALLVWGEQGLGDEVMFASLIPQLVRDGLRVVLDCDARLAPLFARGLPNVTVVARTEPLLSSRLTAPDVVAQIPAGSLPRLMRRRIGDFAGRQPPFLKADPGRVAELRRRIGNGHGHRLVGLSWSSKNASVGHLRSIPPDRLAGALDGADVKLVSLQYGDVAAEAAAAGIADPGLDAWADIDGLAALIAAMDLVVSVDNSTVHLAGGLGCPAWALLPHAADWRWMQGCDDTVWYPSVRLFRQEAPGDWDGVLRKLRKALAES
ncbi:tetratricopeptide repeat protein [Azospirillum lipoferum]|uniref:Uncharacterized protein n=1 Tax=Azospirillum lipoferum (strain 4B) TaxID=862719 RepID=G7ZIS4_AZOL4|nr:tetratricopeptide repeat protein [Azospirillum lipoferum]CBS91612.1 conserved protein of unknown function; TPR repeat domain [Azospirillum lipoferum 4B]